MVSEMRGQRPTFRVKQCSRCGKEFGCGQGEPGCWCEPVVLDRETLAEIRELAGDCLCPACLTSFAQRDGDEAAAGRASWWAESIPHTSIRDRGGSSGWAG